MSTGGTFLNLMNTNSNKLIRTPEKIAVIQMLTGKMKRNNQMPIKMATSKIIEFKAIGYKHYK
jgi:hypothetical protein